MEIIRTVQQLRELCHKARNEGRSVGLVPTMGALHAGHLSLVQRARGENDVVVVSVFVNPTQFNNPDDLRTYPRTERADCVLLESAGVDIVFIPTAAEIYPEPDTRTFDLGTVAEVMEGAMRPGHFNGVAQIVSRLFDYTQPTRAYFGEKDYQQIAVIRHMAATEGFDSIDIIACPICREADGLAMSSRNVRLSAAERAVAPEIHKALVAAVEFKKQGKSIDEVRKATIDRLNKVEHLNVEYFEIADANTLQPLKEWPSNEGGAIGCITVHDGDVRLIDNIKF